MAMEDLSSFFCYQESVEELKQKLIYTTYELQSARIQVEQEVRKNREAMESSKQLLNLLQAAYKERDEAKDQLQKLLLNKLNSSPAAAAPATLSPESPLFNNFHGKSSTGLTESNSLSGESLYDVVSPGNAESTFVQGKKKQQIDPESEVIYNIAKGRPLPIKGKLLEAVMGAGPLLQTLMVAGPMPRWRNPPPLQPLQVPPVMAIGGGGGFDIKNQCGPSSTTTGLEAGPHLLKRPFNGLLPSCSSSSLFLANKVLNFSAGTGGFGNSSAGIGFGSQMAPAPKRHRIQ